MVRDEHVDEDDAELLRVAHRRHRNAVLGTISFMILLTMMILGLGTYAVLHDGKPWWLIPLLLLPSLISLGVMAWLFRLRSRGHRWFPQPIRLGGADRATRRRVGRTVARGELSLDEPDRSLGLELARATDRARWGRWALPLLALAFIVNIVTTDLQWFRVVALAYVVLVVPLAVISWRKYSRIHSLVEQHHETVTPLIKSVIPPDG